MNFENSLFCMPLMVGVIFIIMGFIMLQFPPKKINYMYGYLTKSSVKNQERWNFSQIYSSNLMMYCGVVLIFLSVFELIYTVKTATGVFISTILMFIIVGLLIMKTEQAIKNKFSNEN